MRAFTVPRWPTELSRPPGRVLRMGYRWAREDVEAEKFRKRAAWTESRLVKTVDVTYAGSTRAEDVARMSGAKARPRDPSMGRHTRPADGPRIRQRLKQEKAASPCASLPVPSGEPRWPVSPPRPRTSAYTRLRARPRLRYASTVGLRRPRPTAPISAEPKSQAAAGIGTWPTKSCVTAGQADQTGLVNPTRPFIAV